METPMSDAGIARQSCLASNAAWRRQASHLRQHAAIPHLTEQQGLCLLREAEAADRQADMWLAGAIETH
jgi:hypothetical protein